MNKEKTKKVRFGNSGFFLLLSIVLAIISLFAMRGGGFNRLKALIAIISIFGSAIVAITGLVVSIVRWNHLNFLGKLSFYSLLGLVILLGFMLIPAL